jgi:hypothetical protein
MEEWFYRLTNACTKRAHTLVILTVWCIWKQRNVVVFTESRQSVQAIFTEIKDTCSFWIAAGGRF